MHLLQERAFQQDLNISNENFNSHFTAVRMF
jgi:hypothetical protein